MPSRSPHASPPHSRARSRCGRFRSSPSSSKLMSDASPVVPDQIDAVYRAESRRVLATLIRLLGDFDLAEEALQDAFAEAVEKWPVTGIPSNTRTWLVSAGRFRAIDKLRRRRSEERRVGQECSSRW